MNLRITINLDNDAFADEPLNQAGLILRALANQFLDDEFMVGGPILAKGWPLRDINGNLVGEVKMS